MVWEFGPNKVPDWRRKNTAFLQKWVFEEKFGLSAVHTYKVLIRYRKYGLTGYRHY